MGLDAIVIRHPERGAPHRLAEAVGCSILNWLMLAVAEWLKANGHALPVLRSQNSPGAIEHNRELASRYKGRLSRQLA